MKNLITLYVTIALISMSLSAKLSAKLSAEEKAVGLADRLSELKEEIGLSDEDFERALLRWCQQFEAMSELTPDHPLVKSGEFTVEDLHKQHEINKKLAEALSEQFGQFERFHLIVLKMLNDDRTEEAKGLLRTHVSSTYNRIKNSQRKNTSGLVERVEEEALRDPKLKALIKTEDEGDQD